MNHHESDYGTGQKKLGIYFMGLVFCTILTLLAFWTVMASKFSKGEMLFIIGSAALIQFVVQLLFFLRLNTQTEQGRINVVSIVFTGVILVTIVFGSLWIMWNLNYNMMSMSTMQMSAP